MSVSESSGLALWTALPHTFGQATGRRFSVGAGIRYYLDGLHGVQRQVAFDYVRRAPSTTRTPLRSSFESRWPGPS